MLQIPSGCPSVSIPVPHPSSSPPSPHHTPNTLTHLHKLPRHGTLGRPVEILAVLLPPGRVNHGKGEVVDGTQQACLPRG